MPEMLYPSEFTQMRRWCIKIENAVAWISLIMVTTPQELASLIVRKPARNDS